MSCQWIIVEAKQKELRESLQMGLSSGETYLTGRWLQILTGFESYSVVSKNTCKVRPTRSRLSGLILSGVSSTVCQCG